MKVTKPLLVGGLLVGLVAPAAAFTLPLMVPDICVMGNCIQFTQTAALAQIQGLYQKATQLANEARNLSNIGSTARQPINSEVGQILGTSISRGDVAAGAVLRQSEAAAGSIAGIDAKAGGADGAQQQAQVGNLYLSSIAGEEIKANTLSAQKTLQEKNNAEQTRVGLRVLFRGDVSLGGVDL